MNSPFVIFVCLLIISFLLALKSLPELELPPEVKKTLEQFKNKLSGVLFSSESPDPKGQIKFKP